MCTLLSNQRQNVERKKQTNKETKVRKKERKKERERRWKNRPQPHGYFIFYYTIKDIVTK